MIIDNCPVCNTKIVVSAGTGPICPNEDCPVHDGPFQRNERLSRSRGNPILKHFVSWLHSPLCSGAIVPSSKTLCAAVANQVERSSEGYVLELGSGTGVVTTALLANGIPAHKIYTIELDKNLVDYMHAHFPGVHVIHGNAHNIWGLLPPRVLKNIQTVICGIPLSLLDEKEQWRLSQCMMSVLSPGQQFILYSYRLDSPLTAEVKGITAQRVKRVWRNIPPASIWSYRLD